MESANAGTRLLCGQRLVGITFVWDYVQFQFDDCLLSAYALPSAEIGGVAWRPNEPGWRDRLCDFIGMTVRFTEPSPCALAIGFTDTHSIVIPIEDSPTAESFQLSCPGHAAVLENGS